ncbi:hypothetical protein Bpfe_027644, partial [Biomphalaria pfeifferi]
WRHRTLIHKEISRPSQIQQFYNEERKTNNYLATHLNIDHEVNRCINNLCIQDIPS